MDTHHTHSRMLFSRFHVAPRHTATPPPPLQRKADASHEVPNTLVQGTHPSDQVMKPLLALCLSWLSGLVDVVCLRGFAALQTQGTYGNALSWGDGTFPLRLSRGVRSGPVGNPVGTYYHRQMWHANDGPRGVRAGHDARSTSTREQRVSTAGAYEPYEQCTRRGPRRGRVVRWHQCGTSTVSWSECCARAARPPMNLIV
jgi:hypothetical protein